MKHGVTVILTLVYAVGAGGCTEEGTSSAAVAKRDSAGVTIIEHTAASWAGGPRWNVPEAPTVQIGVESGPPEYLFSGVVGAVRLSDGRIAVANGSSGEIRVYDGTGRFATRVGGRGDGPGEFRRLAWLAAGPGDSLLAYDAEGRRFAVFTPGGAFQRSVPVAAQSTGSPELAGMFADGSVVAAERAAAASAGPGLSSVPLLYLRYDRSGTLLDTLTTVPGPEQFTHLAQGAMSVTTPPFARFPVAAARGEHAFVSANDRFQVDVLAPDGHLRALIRREGVPTPVTGAHLEEVIAAVPNENARRAYRATLAEMPRNRTMPAFSDFVADGSGNLWVREFGRRDELSTWHIVSPRPVAPASIELPSTFRPTDIGEDYVLGVWTDYQGVEHVRLYPVSKQGVE